jgi:hypothetical protein
MSANVTLASWKAQIFESVLGFLPLLQLTVLGLIAALLLLYWGITIQEKIAGRRAARNGQPVPAAAQPGQGRGDDCLGPYTPCRCPRPGQRGSGADHLGAYAQPSAGTGDGTRS